MARAGHGSMMMVMIMIMIKKMLINDNNEFSQVPIRWAPGVLFFSACRVPSLGNF